MLLKFRFLALIVLAFAFIARVEAQVATGTPPFASFGGGPDVINLANLNAHWTIPVFQRPGRGGDSLNYIVSYDTAIWSPVSASGAAAWTPATNWGWTSSTAAVSGYLGYQLSETFICPYMSGKNLLYYGALFTYYNWRFQDHLGTVHAFSGSTQSGYSTNPTLCSPPKTTSLTVTINDGSGYVLNATGGSGAVYNTNGTLIAPPINAFAGAGTLTDRNGNIISIDNSGNITDTLGTVALTVAGSGTPSSPITLTYTVPSGSPVAYTLNYTNYTVATNFNVSGVAEYRNSSPVPLISSISLPDGSSYVFKYEATPSTPSSGACTPLSGTYSTNCVTGRLVSITLPTGGPITYAYSGGINGSNGILSDGSTATLTRTTPDGTWTYAQAKNTAPASTTTVTDPQNDVTTIHFQGIYETQRVVNQGSSTLLTRDTCYNGAASPCTGTAIALPITAMTVWNVLGGSGGWQDAHAYSYDGYGNLLQQGDYDYGPGAFGSLLDTTTVTYASLDNIKSFRQTVTVTNGSGATVSKTNYNYDEGTLQPSSGTPQHTSVTGSRGNLTSVNLYTTTSS